MKKNCWEILKCGRQPGKNSSTLGACPVPEKIEANSINGGKNAGRICWAVAGTMCNEEIQGEYAKKRTSCLTCEVYQQVKKEEGDDFQVLLPGQLDEMADSYKSDFFKE